MKFHGHMGLGKDFAYRINTKIGEPNCACGTGYRYGGGEQG